MLKQCIVARILTPLILRDAIEREQGRKPDKPYWADMLAIRWGYLVPTPDVGWYKPWPHVRPYITESIEAGEL